jgi:simple sugar transport system ATP-binding protein
VNQADAPKASVEPPVIETRGITKSFGPIRALCDVDLTLHPGEVVGLVGDNGAGKSTLIKILSGVIFPSEGEIRVHGQSVQFQSPLQARGIGIETVHQTLSLVPHLNVWTNLFLGRELVARGPLGWFGWVDKRRMAARARAELDRVGINVPSVDMPCEALSGGQRQAVAVARAIAWGTRVILMDEPTAALGVEERRKVEGLMATVRGHGIPVLLVSHDLPEVHRIADRIVVLRLGRVVANLNPTEASVEDMVMWITGATTLGNDSSNGGSD